MTLLSCYAAFCLLRQNSLPELFGMETSSFPAQLVLLGFLFSILLAVSLPSAPGFPEGRSDKPTAMRAQLTEAPEALASALVKMSRDNLSNLHPHPLYAAIYYSHPPVVERVRTLLSMEKRND